MADETNNITVIAEAHDVDDDKDLNNPKKDATKIGPTTKDSTTEQKTNVSKASANKNGQTTGDMKTKMKNKTFKFRDDTKKLKSKALSDSKPGTSFLGIDCLVFSAWLRV